MKVGDDEKVFVALQRSIIVDENGHGMARGSGVGDVARECRLIIALGTVGEASFLDQFEELLHEQVERFRPLHDLRVLHHHRHGAFPHLGDRVLIAGRIDRGPGPEGLVPFGPTDLVVETDGAFFNGLRGGGGIWDDRSRDAVHQMELVNGRHPFVVGDESAGIDIDGGGVDRSVLLREAIDAPMGRGRGRIGIGTVGNALFQNEIPEVLEALEDGVVHRAARVGLSVHDDPRDRILRDGRAEERVPECVAVRFSPVRQGRIKLREVVLVVHARLFLEHLGVAVAAPPPPSTTEYGEGCHSQPKKWLMRPSCSHCRRRRRRACRQCG